MFYLIIYLKENGRTLFKFNKSYPVVKKGQKTSMGWTVLDVQYYFNGRFYNFINYSRYISEFSSLQSKRIEKNNKLKKLLRVLSETFK